MPWLSAGVAEYAPENHWLESHPRGRSVVSDVSRRLRTGVGSDVSGKLEMGCRCHACRHSDRL